MTPNKVFRITRQHHTVSSLLLEERALMGDSSWVSLLSHLQATVVPKRIRNCSGGCTSLFQFATKALRAWILLCREFTLGAA